MLTEKEIQSFEELIQQLSERRRHHTSRQLNEVLQSHRELQAENASLRSQIATETAKVELMDRQIAGLVEHQHKMRLEGVNHGE